MEKKIVYYKSTLTGQVFRGTEFPIYKTYVPSNEEEFNSYYISKGIDPKTLPRF